MRLVGLSGKAAELGVYSVVTGKGGGTIDCMIVVLGIKEDLLWLCWARLRWERLEAERWIGTEHLGGHTEGTAVP